MKKYFFMVSIAVATGILCVVSTCNIDTASGPTPYKVDKSASILAQLQRDYVAMKFGMFFHFNMSTFNRCCCPQCYSVEGEWGNQEGDGVSVKEFRPSKLNCGQWADVAKSAGCKYAVLTVKHHDGFCLWPSKYSEYSVKNATCTTNVFKMFADSMRSRGLKVGFYYSIRDKSNGFKMDFIKGQLTELLNKDVYGDIVCIWFDGWEWFTGYVLVPYKPIRDLIKSIQPNCLLIENNHKYNLANTEIVEYEMPIDGAPAANNTLPSEGSQVIRASADHCWFWHPIDECTMMSKDAILEEKAKVNARNATYMLNLTPDTLGLIPQCQVDRMKEVGQALGITQ